MCSLEHDLTLKTTAKRYRNNIDVPEGVNIEDAIKIYNQGYGHSLAASMYFLTEYIGLMEVDSELKDAYIKYMLSKRKRSGVHLVKKG